MMSWLVYAYQDDKGIGLAIILASTIAVFRKHGIGTEEESSTPRVQVSDPMSTYVDP